MLLIQDKVINTFVMQWHMAILVSYRIVVDAVTRYAFLQPIQERLCDGSGKGNCLLQRRKSL